MEQLTIFTPFSPFSYVTLNTNFQRRRRSIGVNSNSESTTFYIRIILHNIKRRVRRAIVSMSATRHKVKGIQRNLRLNGFLYIFQNGNKNKNQEHKNNRRQQTTNNTL